MLSCFFFVIFLLLFFCCCLAIDTQDSEEEEEEGWEKVQRGGRLKARQSPSQKSLDNVNEMGKSGKKSLTRSISAPDSTTKEKPGMVSGSQDKHGVHQSMQAISEQDLSDSRKRLDSKGSEKENIPDLEVGSTGDLLLCKSMNRLYIMQNKTFKVLSHRNRSLLGQVME